MKITRDGKVIELTPQELLAAYYEQEHKFDLEDVRGELELYSECDGTDAYLAKKLLADSAKLSEIARDKRRNIDKYDMEWQDATQAAIMDALFSMAGI